MSNGTWTTVGCAVAILVAITVAYHFTSRNRGREPIIHVIYFACVAATMFFLPTDIASYIFSALSVTIIGTVFPTYESIRAICTPEEEDDKAWLQYWMVGGVFFIATGWVDDVLYKHDHDEGHPSVTYWYEAASFAYFWLFFPKTDGAALLYDKITKPYIAPRVRPLTGKMKNIVTAIYQTLMNAVHLWLLWFIFIILPSSLKRMIAVAIGTIFPLISSITAATTEEVEDDTYWLTYWSCYGILYLLMEILETWLGWIPGFYSLVIFTTVYLMLPMFQGADKVFRKIIVPVAGLSELLLLRDAISVKKRMLEDLDTNRSQALRQAVAKLFSEDDDTDPTELKNQYLSGWNGLRVSNPFSKKKPAAEGGPDESTNLV